MKKAFLFIIIVLLCFTQTGCLTFLTIAFPENKTIQTISDAHLDWLENNMPILNKDCVINNISLCFNGGIISKDKKIRTDGFYYCPQTTRDSLGNVSLVDYYNDFGCLHSTYRIAFYPDKMYCGSLWIENEMVGANEWGLYDIQNDTIITECFVLGNMNGSMYGIHDTLIIKSLDTIYLLNRTPICPETTSYYLNNYRPESGEKTNESVVLCFAPFDRLPDSNKAWIKKKKWFWCDENEWKQYKEARKKMDRNR
jgi:hypothetical protein